MQLIKKHDHFDGFDKKILAMYAREMSVSPTCRDRRRRGQPGADQPRDRRGD